MYPVVSTFHGSGPVYRVSFLWGLESVVVASLGVCFVLVGHAWLVLHLRFRFLYCSFLATKCSCLPFVGVLEIVA